MSGPSTLHLTTDGRARLTREALSVGAFALAASATAVLAGFARTRTLHDLALAAIFVLLGGVAALALDARRRSQLLAGWVAEVDDGQVVVRTPLEERRIVRGRVESIVVTIWPARGLVLRDDTGANVFLPEAMEQFAEVRERLSAWREIERSRVPELVAKAWPLVIFSICLLEALAIGGRGGWNVAAASLLLALVGLWSLANALRSRRLSLRGRALSVLLLAPITYLVVHAVHALR